METRHSVQWIPEGKSYQKIVWLGQNTLINPMINKYGNFIKLLEKCITTIKDYKIVYPYPLIVYYNYVQYSSALL